MLGFWWKQYAYAQSDQWTKLCNALGARLDAGHETYAATWCYICAGNVEKAVDIWARTLNVRNGGVDFVDLLQVRVAVHLRIIRSVDWQCIVGV